MWRRGRSRLRERGLKNVKLALKAFDSARKRHHFHVSRRGLCHEPTVGEGEGIERTDGALKNARQNQDICGVMGNDREIGAS